MTRQPSFISSHAAHPRRVVIAASLHSDPPTVKIDTEFIDLGDAADTGTDDDDTANTIAK